MPAKDENMLRKIITGNELRYWNCWNVAIYVCMCVSALCA